jgi:YYY domain-containing protein
MKVSELPFTPSKPKIRKLPSMPWVWDVLLIGILIIGAYLRFVGISWDDVYHLHPDERFMTMVETSIQPVQNLSQYFDTSTSTLNPNNMGYSFYVYGTFPLFFVRYIAEFVNQTGYGQVHIVGRAVSAVFNLLTILFVYLLCKRLYKNARLGLVASLFLSFSVLAIQLSHFFAVDTFATFFTTAGLYVLVCIFTPKTLPEGEPPDVPEDKWYWLKKDWRSVGLYLVFAVLYGMAMACKVSTWPLALFLPLAAFIRYKKLNNSQQQYEYRIIIRNIVLAGILAFVTFRIFQPYAFTGPSFFNFTINPQWITSLKELAAQSSGDADVPFALQWARRPITFAFTNMVEWGLGLPLGILAWAGVLWMAWRIIKGDWQKHLVLWGWTVLFFLSQALVFNPMMRYQLPIYPELAIIAAWVIFKLWEDGEAVVRKLTQLQINWRRVLAVTISILAIAGTGLWAFAFSQIYTRPVTRVAASSWIFENIPGAINLSIKSDSGAVNEPIAYSNVTVITPDSPYVYDFYPQENAALTQISIGHVLLRSASNAQVTLLATVYQVNADKNTAIASGFIQSEFPSNDDSNGSAAAILLNAPVALEKDKKYEITIEVVETDSQLQLMGDVTLTYNNNGKPATQYLPAIVNPLKTGTSFTSTFSPVANGTISTVELNRVVDLLQNSGSKTLSVNVVDVSNQNTIIGTGSLTDKFLPVKDVRGESKTIQLDQPVSLDKTHSYALTFYLNPSADGSNSILGIYNNVLATESSWDDSLPLSMNNYNVWDANIGLFGNNKNFEMYWDDNETKLARFENILDTTDTITISSNRQWGTTTRVPERYPLTIAYYRNLLGCPADKDLLWCYQVAQPGMFEGKLGFKLTAVFQSDPNIGTFSINDQSAEEAFTVYDHPKVLIFEKTSDYAPAKVKEILGEVDLTQVVHMTPGQASKFNGNLMLSETALKIQQAGGTFAKLFNPNSWINSNDWVTGIVWYLLILLLGLIVYPFTRLALKKLPDHGYPFSRLIGLLLLALFTWLASSNGAVFSQTTIFIVLAVLVVGNGILAFYQREELKEEFKQRKWYFLIVELVFLAFFLIDLRIRLGNPDLWHPWKGGEKPMDLSYFTAVLKSSTFPPYDPWFAGGYINYYYYGFVIVGVPVKLLGILPTTAYNLILPTLFGLTAVGAFSIGWNLLHGQTLDMDVDQKKADRRAFGGGILSSFAVLIMGNLGTLRMIWQGAQKLVAPGGVIDGVSIFQRWGWFFSGMLKFFQGASLPYGTGDWYWIPSRALPGDTITEFPFFTFTYADLHAHLIALPITLLAIGWGLSILLGKWQWGQSGKQRVIAFAGSFALGGIVIGALRPTNTWDLPTYLALASIIILYTAIRYAVVPNWFFPKFPAWLRKCCYAVSAVAILGILLYVFYLPFSKWYGQAYGSIDPWTADEHTDIASYLTHWGLFLFVIVTWLIWEVRDWMASTPATALRSLKKYAVYLETLVILFLLVVVILVILGVSIAWLSLPIGLMALTLILRPGQPDVKRLILFMIGTAMVLTLFVELFALHGDIGRMNTVFKFYYQAWTLLALSSAAAFMWLIPSISTQWNSRFSAVWQVVLAVLLFGALLYPLTAAQDKMADRMSADAPHTLDGMAYMKTSYYGDQNTTFELSQDYDAIKWMQQNVQGSPVIVEGNTVEYRWGTRFTIYTGLPGVVGWNWHQRQQRGFLADTGVWARINEIPVFYTTTDLDETLSFLKKYNVKYIIVGQLEEAYYPGDGLKKFTQYNGTYWKEVFQEKNTTIYEVLSTDLR